MSACFASLRLSHYTGVKIEGLAPPEGEQAGSNLRCTVLNAVFKDAATKHQALQRDSENILIGFTTMFETDIAAMTDKMSGFTPIWAPERDRLNRLTPHLPTPSGLRALAQQLHFT